MWWHKWILRHTIAYTNLYRRQHGYVDRKVLCSCGKVWWVNVMKPTTRRLGD